MPDQLFYNTGIFTYVWLVTNRKPPERRGKVQLIDGTRFFQKMKKSLNNKRNEITEEQIRHLTRVYGNYQDGETAEVQINGETETRVISRIFENREFGFLQVTVERPLRMNFEATPERIAKLDDQTAFANLATSKKRKDTAAAESEIAEGRKAAGRHPRRARDARRQRALPGPGGLRDRCDEGRQERKDIKILGPIKKAIFAALGERDPERRGLPGQQGPPGARQRASETPRIYPCRPARTSCSCPWTLGLDKPNDRLISAFREDIDVSTSRGKCCPMCPMPGVD